MSFLKRLHSGDTLVVTKLDRFARTVIEGVLTVRTLFERGVKVHILNIGLIENTLTGNLILTVFLAFAEFERGMIIERTQAGEKPWLAHSRVITRGRPKKIYSRSDKSCTGAAQQRQLVPSSRGNDRDKQEYID